MRTFEFAEPMARKTAEAEFFCPAHAWPAYLKNVAIGAPEPLSRSLAHARAPFLQRDSVPWRTPTASLRSRIFHPPVRTGALPPEGLTCAWPDLAKLPSTSRPRSFFSESAAQELTLRGPGLPHHRHALTADEALAGLLLAIALIASVAAFIVGWLL